MDTNPLASEFNLWEIDLAGSPPFHDWSGLELGHGRCAKKNPNILGRVQLNPQSKISREKLAAGGGEIERERERESGDGEEGEEADTSLLLRGVRRAREEGRGAIRIHSAPIHFLEERFYFGDDVLPCFESGIPLLLQRLRQLPDADNVTIAFPDDGAWKRFHKQLQNFPMVVCAKVREGDKRIVRIKEGNPEGRHVVIVDDLVQSGGTLIECQKVLAAHGAAKVSAYVTHGVFPKQSWERFLQNSSEGLVNSYAYFWITDSCPLTVKAIGNRAPFEVLSLAGSIADALQI
ncbi:ribose-phosphate pyrophosphokinase 4 isoform X2 [Phoenix dactylifera]|uniref:Ribose-phosphate pyrophosphokinase 4 isoform X2 n=1 Tax=Phoenix dactylifera TaxID=42345 RepID=A0A8B8ZHE7_PHODC|nr:ribose-phosphate pyrophosphokinase 4 isoform X2 [Phoenix dactylifera]